MKILKFYTVRRIAVLCSATILLTSMLCSCKGRKMSNMEPTGDTVEVEVTPLHESSNDDDIYLNTDENDEVDSTFMQNI